MMTATILFIIFFVIIVLPDVIWPPPPCPRCNDIGSTQNEPCIRCQGPRSGLVAALDAKAPLQEPVNTVAATGSTETLPDITSNTVHRLTLDANCTLTFPTAGAGKSFTLVLVQDATGSRTVTWPGTVKWSGGVAPTLSTGAGKIDYLTFMCTDGTNWAGFVAGLDMR
jgi:hypothetical protein